MEYYRRLAWEDRDFGDIYGGYRGAMTYGYARLGRRTPSSKEFIDEIEDVKSGEVLHEEINYDTFESKEEAVDRLLQYIEKDRHREAAFGEMTRRATELEEDYETARENDKNMIERITKQYLSEEEKLQTTIGQTRAELSNVIRENERLLEEQQRRLDHSTDSIDDVISRLKFDLAAVTKEKDILAASNQDLTRKVEFLSTNITEPQFNIAVMRQAIDNKDAKIEELDSKLDDLRDRIKSMHEPELDRNLPLEDKLRINNEYESELAKLTDSVRRLNDERDRVEAEKNDVIKQAVRDSKRASKDLTTAELRIAELNIKLESFIASRDRYYIGRSHHGKIVKRMNSVIKQSEVQHREDIGKIKDMQKDIDRLSALEQSMASQRLEPDNIEQLKRVIRDLVDVRNKLFNLDILLSYNDPRGTSTVGAILAGQSKYTSQLANRVRDISGRPIDMDELIKNFDQRLRVSGHEDSAHERQNRGIQSLKKLLESLGEHNDEHVEDMDKIMIPTVATPAKSTLKKSSSNEAPSKKTPSKNTRESIGEDDDDDDDDDDETTIPIVRQSTESTSNKKTSKKAPSKKVPSKETPSKKAPSKKVPSKNPK